MDELLDSRNEKPAARKLPQSIAITTVAINMTITQWGARQRPYELRMKTSANMIKAGVARRTTVIRHCQLEAPKMVQTTTRHICDVTIM